VVHPAEREEVAMVSRGRLEIGGWACNDGVTIVRMFELQVAGFTTDRPDLALQPRGLV
jgi:hypothetical protein